MADEAAGKTLDGAGNGDGAAKSEAAASPLVVHGQYIKDLSFENPNAPRSIVQSGEKPGVKVDVGVSVRKIANNTFESVLSFEAQANQGETALYNLELEFAGLFHIENMPNEALEPVLMVNCPALLFPFIRRIVADLTRDGGFAPFWLDPIDFAALYVERQRRAQQGSGENQTV